MELNKFTSCELVTLSLCVNVCTKLLVLQTCLSLQKHEEGKYDFFSFLYRYFVFLEYNPGLNKECTILDFLLISDMSIF